MSSHAKIPGKWKNVLRNDDNNDELFQFLGQECVLKTPETRSSYTAYRAMSLALEMVRILKDFNHAYSHEEADTRMRLPVKYTMNCGLKSLVIRTFGTYMVVLAVAHFQGLPNIT